MSFDFSTLITDRTSKDIERAKTLAAKRWSEMSEDEKTEWKSSLNGAYNASDINRVNTAVNYLAERLVSTGYDVNVSAKTDYKIEDVPSTKDLTTYLENIAALRVVTMQPTTPDLPETMRWFTYDEANAIEKFLVDLDVILTAVEASWIYSSEIYSGEV